MLGPILRPPLAHAGCTLHVDPVLALRLQVDAAGTTTVQLPLPNEPRLLGGEVVLQAAVLDAGANPLGLAFSPGLRLVVGN